jgi:hypothetical protein
MKKNNQTYLIQFKKRKDEKTGIWIDSTKAIIVTSRRKEAVSEIQSDLEIESITTKKVTRKFSGGQHMDYKSPLTKEKNQINTYLKDIISTVTDSDELYILALLRLNKVRTKNKC